MTDVVTDKIQLSKWIEDKRARRCSIGFVPTQGALHEGHASLIRRSLADNDVTAVSVFVNPLQFRPDAYEVYPRNVPKDIDYAAKIGASLIYAPEIGDIYPGSNDLDSLFAIQEKYQRSDDVYRLQEPWSGAEFDYIIVPSSLACRLDGSMHPWHFDGVATVVKILLEAVRPDTAYFGEKDAQQVAILYNLVLSYGIDVEIKKVRIHREGDGLASSSRLTRLSHEGRAMAATAVATMHDAARMIGAGLSPHEARSRWRRAAQDVLGYDLDHLDIVRARDLQQSVETGDEALLYLAYYIEGLRLADCCYVTVS